MQITYIILVILIYVFHILYKGDLSFILLVFLLVMPAVILALLIIQTRMLKITVYRTSRPAERGKPEILKIVLENPSVFPITACRLTVSYKSSFPPDKFSTEKYSVVVPISQRTKESVTLSFTPEHCGYFDITLKSAGVSDMLGLVTLFKKVRFKDRVVVLPAVFPFEPDMGKSFAHSNDSDIFSSSRSGDDPSEIFQLREYRAGDSMNRIHWKLSGRGEEFIVKELSEPISSRILIICDAAACKNAESLDKVLDMTATIALFLSGAAAAYTIAAAADDGTVFTADVSGQEAAFAALTGLCCGSVSYTNRLTDDIYSSATAELIKKGYSQIMVISADTDKTFIDELARICGETKLTVFCTTPPSFPAEDKNDDNFFAEIIYSTAEELDEKYSGSYSDTEPYADQNL